MIHKCCINSQEPIAIIGLSCKFAGRASNPEGLWQMLAAGRSAWTEIPTSRFNLKGAYNPNAQKLSTVHTRGGHFLEQDLAFFDAPFFNLSAETASSLDPQIRLLLECVYEALENAGITLPKAAGTNTAVYVAGFGHDYRDGILRDEDNLPRLLSTGTGDAMFSNRISYFYDLKGPSFTLDAGCSGGLVAFHQGFQSLRSGESDMAVICGSNLCLNPDMFKSMGSLGVLSADGKSFAFDSRANGFGRGEGVATLVIKRLSDAINGQDPIRAIVRESGLNQDGKTGTITTPSEEAQVALMRDCYRRAGLQPRDTQYFEAHGTGTATGDPIECRAIATVFEGERSSAKPLCIGSVKTNVGHTESVSGLASLIKVVLALEKGKIPPSVNFENPNPRIALDDWRLRVATELEDWPMEPGGVRRASINNFGYGGTNGHLIVENAATGVSASRVGDHTASAQVLESRVLVFSAQDDKACQSMVNNLREYLGRQSGSDQEALLGSVAHTLGQHRTRFAWVAADYVPINEGLKGVMLALEPPKFSPRRTRDPPRVGMVFTGQGAQWYAMGRELILAYPIFAASLREADKHIKALGGQWSVSEELLRSRESSRINQAEFSTPVCVAVQISLVRLLDSWGVKPAAVTSHSSGEIASAYAAGAISYKSAMAVAYYRGLLVAEQVRSGPRGAMIAVGLNLHETEAHLDQVNAKSDSAVVACVNSPSSITVSGDEDAVLELESILGDQGIFVRRLEVESAFHSHHMKPVAEPYHKALQFLVSAKDQQKGMPQVAPSFSSPVTGGRVGDLSQLSKPEHWVDSLLQRVRFVDAFADMVLGDANIDVIVEVGPHTALSGPIREILSQPEFADLELPYVGCLVRGINAVQSMHALAANLLSQGLPVDLDAVNFPHGRPSSAKILTDLPSYPWNHQTRHWCESRFNKALRERSQPPHDLIGSLVLGTDLENPTWRHILRIRDSPWVREHMIQGNILYPASGFVAAAIEAMRQLSDLWPKDGRTTVGYRLREIDIMKALIIPGNDEGIEIQTTLRQVTDKEISNRGWKRFEISSVTLDNEWTIHAQGLIKAESEDAPDKTVPKPRPGMLSGYTRKYQGSDLYASLKAQGINHGKLFQAITDIEQNGNNQRADSLLIVPDASLPTDLPYQALIHPTTLDAVIHSAYSLVLGVRGQESGKIPRSIGSLWVSGAISQKAGHCFKAFSFRSHVDGRVLRADITLSDHNDSAAIVLEIRDIVYQSLGQCLVEQQDNRQWEEEPCMRLEWAPDHSLMSVGAQEQMERELSKQVDAEEVQILTDIRRVCVYFVSEALSCLTTSDLQRLKRHHVKFYNWMKSLVELAADGQIGPSSAHWLSDTPEERQALILKVQNASLNGELVCHLGPSLTQILRQEKEPLELMMEGNLLYRYYRQGLKIERTASLAVPVFQNLIHKNPCARILEIGGGTGILTRYVLPKIRSGETGGALADLYHFTDISPTFFAAAKEEFVAWSDIMKYDKLDIEVDPARQGFDLESYDIILAAEVLHATKSMSRTMSHVRSLMKPGATLILIETTQDQVDNHFVFGLLPGWWLAEEPHRALSPCMSVARWDDTLRASGFTGVDFNVRDCESDEWSTVSVMTTIAEPALQQSIPRSDSIVLVTRQLAFPEQRWLRDLQSRLELAGAASVALGTATAADYNNKWVVFLGEVDKPLLLDLDAAGLENLQTMIKHCSGLLWVTRGGAVNCERPGLSLAAGFLRSIRHEYVGRKFVTLDLDPNKPWSDASVGAILQVLITSFGTTTGDTPPYEFEYAERGGTILIPRLFRDDDRNQLLFPKPVDWSSPESIPIEPLFQPGRHLALKIGVPGLLKTLAFDDQPSTPDDDSRFPLDCIEIEPRAYGVNFRDVLVAMGHLEERIMGRDIAGVITHVGSEAADHGYAVGDRVFGLTDCGYGNRARVHWTSARRIPENLSFEQAASIPAVYVTVYLCLYKLARLQPGQKILIHAGSGGVGDTAIQFAKLIGAEVFTTVGSNEKRAQVMERHGIPSDHIFSSRDCSFAADIRKATDGRGVDVVLNSLSGPLLQESLNILAPLGHFIELGKRDIEQNNYLEMKPFSRPITFTSFDLRYLYEQDNQLVHSALAEVGRLLEHGDISPVSPITTYSLSEIDKVFRLLQTGKHTGKVVLSVSRQEQVRVLPRAPTARLRADATYLLVGGAGGIGSSIANWLVSRGARHLIVLSRSAEISQAALELVTELEPRGCSVKLISCDASREEALAAALKGCSEDLPPIRGVIQGAMVLQDSVIESMTFDQYKSALTPKVNVSWNLHNQTRKLDLDFFIFLSSMSGIYGMPSQSNYSAGNAFEDALAHWRVSQDLPGVALDLGPVKGVGYVAETPGVADRMVKMGHFPVTEDQVLRVLESAVLNPFDKQISMGINQGPGAHWQTDGAVSLGREARFRALRYRQGTQSQIGTGYGSTNTSFANQLSVAETWHEVEVLVVDAIIKKLAAIFMIRAEDIDPAKHLSEYGLDSLGAVELRNMLALEIAVDVSVVTIMQSESVKALAAKVVPRHKRV